MIRSELVDALAAQMPHLSIKDADAAVKGVFDAMGEALAKGHRIEIRGFGSFTLNHRRPRIGRNPRTGESVSVPSKRAAHFKPGKELRARVELAGDAARAQVSSASDTHLPSRLYSA